VGVVVCWKAMERVFEKEERKVMMGKLDLC